MIEARLGSETISLGTIAMDLNARRHDPFRRRVALMAQPTCTVGFGSNLAAVIFAVNAMQPVHHACYQSGVGWVCDSNGVVSATSPISE